jgi:hypothetical protein
MSFLQFKKVGDGSIGLASDFVRYLKGLSSFLGGDSTTIVYVLDGDVDGFHVVYFKTEDYVGITVVPPIRIEQKTAIPRLLEALPRILHLSIGQLENAKKIRVLLRIIDIGIGQDLTHELTDIMNHRSVKPDAGLNYTGMKSEGIYLFELPYQGSLSDLEFTCGKYVKVDLHHPQMETEEARAFFTRLGNDLTLCRGQSYLQLELAGTPESTAVLYLMFRNKVSADEKWWASLENVAYVCAAIWAEVDHGNSSMDLLAICSRPGTTGAVAKMLENISIDAKTTYGLNRLVLTAANDELENIYRRPAYGFVKAGRDMVKYLTASGSPEAKESAAAKSPDDSESYFAGFTNLAAFKPPY